MSEQKRIIQIKAGDYYETVHGNVIHGDYHAAGNQQTLAQAAAEIQALLKQLAQTYPSRPPLNKWLSQLKPLNR